MTNRSKGNAKVSTPETVTVTVTLPRVERIRVGNKGAVDVPWHAIAVPYPKMVARLLAQGVGRIFGDAASGTDSLKRCHNLVSHYRKGELTIRTRGETDAVLRHLRAIYGRRPNVKVADANKATYADVRTATPKAWYTKAIEMAKARAADDAAMAGEAPVDDTEGDTEE